MEKQTKVKKYEEFLNDRLKIDLRKILEDLDLLYSEMAEYLQVKDTISKIQNLKSKSGVIEPIDTKVDLGCNFYANAVINDPSKVFIAIHYGFYLEMTHEEALKFIEKKVEILNGHLKSLKAKEAEIKANIRFVLEGLREIQNIEFGLDSNRHSLFL